MPDPIFLPLPSSEEKKLQEIASGKGKTPTPRPAPGPTAEQYAELTKAPLVPPVKKEPELPGFSKTLYDELAGNAPEAVRPFGETLKRVLSMRTVKTAGKVAGAISRPPQFDDEDLDTLTNLFDLISDPAASLTQLGRRIVAPARRGAEALGIPLGAQTPAGLLPLAALPTRASKEALEPVEGESFYQEAARREYAEPLSSQLIGGAITDPTMFIPGGAVGKGVKGTVTGLRGGKARAAAGAVEQTFEDLFPQGVDEARMIGEALKPEDAAYLRQVIVDAAPEPGIAGQAKRVRQAAPPGTAAKINGVATGELTPSHLHTDPAVAKEELRQTMDSVVVGSQLDETSAAYLKSGSILDYAKGVKPDVPVDEEMATYAFTDRGRRGLGMADPTRTIESIDGGVFGGLLQKQVLWPTHNAMQAFTKYVNKTNELFGETLDRHLMNTFGAKKYRVMATDVLDELRPEMATWDAARIMQWPTIKSVLRGVDETRAASVVDFARDVRKLFDRMFTEQNLVRGARNQPKIEYREAYVPHIYKTNMWAKYGFGSKLPKDVMEGAMVPDFIHPDAAFNPREFERTGLLGKDVLKRDLFDLVSDYINTAGRDIFYTDVIRNARAHTKALRARAKLPMSDPTRLDLMPAADAIDDWISEAFAGTPSAFTRFVKKSGLEGAAQGLMFIRRMMVRAVFPLNWTWMMGMQVTSMPVTVKLYGAKHTAAGLDYIFNPAARQWTHDMVYAAKIKRQGSGQFEGGLSNVAIVAAALKRSPVDKPIAIFNFFNNALETVLTGISTRAAYHDGLARGFTGRKLVEWASEGGAKTQSMYNIHDRVGMLRSPELQALFPFQTFAFEMWNMIRETAPGPLVMRTGAYKEFAKPGALVQRLAPGQTAEQAERLRTILYFIAMITATNYAADAVFGRKPWVVSSFLPFYGLLTGQISRGSPSGGLLSQTYVKDFYSGIADWYQTGDKTRFIRWATRYHVPAGVQLDRMIEGAEATMRGTVTDRVGRELFPVETNDPLERLHIWTAGPTQGSKEGRAYIKKLEEAKGPLGDVLGFGLPRRINTVKELSNVQEQFGDEMVDDEGMPYVFAPKHYAIEARKVRGKVGLNRFANEAPELARAMADYEVRHAAFNDLPDEPRIRDAYLRHHPDFDAEMFFWGGRATVRSLAAKRKAVALMEKYDIPAEALPDTRYIIR